MCSGLIAVVACITGNKLSLQAHRIYASAFWKVRYNLRAKSTYNFLFKFSQGCLLSWRSNATWPVSRPPTSTFLVLTNNWNTRPFGRGCVTQWSTHCQTHTMTENHMSHLSHQGKKGLELIWVRPYNLLTPYIQKHLQIPYLLTALQNHLHTSKACIFTSFL